jgi:MFS family permease
MPSRRSALASLSLATLLPSLDASITNVALPTLAEAFGAPFPVVQWVVLSYLLTLTLSLVLVGRLGDVVGARRLFLAGVAVFTLASMACAMARTMEQLIAARALQGLGAAIMLALATALVAEAVPKHATGRAMGLLGTMSAVGTTLGPPAGGAAIAALGWPSLFYLSVPLGVATAALALRGLPRDRPEDRAPGAARLGPAGAIRQLRERGAALALTFLVATVMMTTLLVGPFYLTRALALAPGEVGVVVAIGPCVAALAGVPAGRAVDRVGASRAVVAGLVGLAGGFLLLTMMPTAAGVAGYVGSIVVVTASYALFQAANGTAIMAGARAEQRGVVSGLLGLSRNLGLMSGASVMGAVFALGSGTRELTTAPADAIAQGMHRTFAVAAGLVFLGAFVAVRQLRLDPREASAPPAVAR